MSRLPRRPVEEWDAELRSLTASEIGVMPVLAANPDMAKAVARLYGAIATHQKLPKRLLELVRLRIAYRNQCRTCVAVRYGTGADDLDVDEEAVCALEKPLESELFSTAEKAAIVFADRMAADHLNVNDDMFADLRNNFAAPEIIELCVVISTYIGFGRLAAALHMVEVLPEEYQADQSAPFTPWRNAGVRVAR